MLSSATRPATSGRMITDSLERREPTAMIWRSAVPMRTAAASTGAAKPPGGPPGRPAAGAVLPSDWVVYHHQPPTAATTATTTTATIERNIVRHPTGCSATGCPAPALPPGLGMGDLRWTDLN